ncbi:MAG: spore germination protein [Anaerobacillus sp.]|uniref:spore germination protein n=1 Tax=Anaerobacillus sp. TaxID=1872506 RepID=UPI00391AC782
MTNTLDNSLQNNISKIKSDLGNSTDLIIRYLNVNEKISVGLVYLDGLSNKELIEYSIIESLLKLKDQDSSDFHLEFLKEKILANPEISNVKDFQTLYSALLSGDTAIFIEGKEEAFIASTRKAEERTVAEPTTQVVIRGPKDGFVENITVNVALIRRRIKDHNLWLETREIGKVTKTSVSIMFLHGTVEEKILNEVRTRLDQIDTNSILESGYIEEFIQDSAFSPFPTVYNTERPDIIAAGILEGRIAILIDGTPFVLLVPALFNHFIQAAEDYYNRSDFGLIRILRLVCLGISLLAPSIYVALTTYHQETIPTVLLISLAAQREGVPFPAFFEAFFMEIVFEILREAGLRMPRMVGQTMSIVGALVIGQAAVEAGLISNAMIIVVAITAIASFVAPGYSIGISMRLLRFPMMFLAATFGLYGIAVGLMFLILHLASLKSFTIPYMYNIGPFKLRRQRDTIIRLPQKM